MTRPRVAVYEALAELGGHRSVDEIVAVVAGRGTRLPRTSVYNVVEDLVGVGLLSLADAGPGRALYEVASEPHYHFVCRDCGVVEDVVPHELVDEGLQLDLPGAEIDGASVIYRGRCARCTGAA